MRFLLAAALIVALGAPPGASAAPTGKLLVAIDAGHGGEKDGAIGPGGVKEKDLALAIARRLEAKLQAAGHEVVLTRTKDETVKLPARVKLANEKGADVFVSVHCNSMPRSRQRRRVSGVETYFLSAGASDAAAADVARKENADDEEHAAGASGGAVGAILADLARTEAHADSSRLAYALHGKLVAATGAKDRGVHQAPFLVLEGAAMPAVLVEVGYISHPAESKRLAEAGEQDRIAAAVTEGIAEFQRDVLSHKEQ